MFNIPIVLFIFKRADKSVEIIKRISLIKPTKLYLIADGGRDSKEHQLALKTRLAVKNAVTWKCEIIENFSSNNRGVYENIANGAKWVFSLEEQAIFLEDDNLPEISFFHFCKELLTLYRYNDQILYIAGTNYLNYLENAKKFSYVFSRNMFPCGWASWSDKFNKFYDGNFDYYSKSSLKKIRKHYSYKNFYKYDTIRFDSEIERKNNGFSFNSWDYQLAFSLRYFNKLCVVPNINQIKNIGVDNSSIHGGNNSDMIMTNRLTKMDSFPINFPLVHPLTVKINKIYEHKIEKYLTPPSYIPTVRLFIILLRKLLGIPNHVPLKTGIRNFFRL